MKDQIDINHVYTGMSHHYRASDTPNVCLFSSGWRSQKLVNARIKAFDGKDIIVWKKVLLARKGYKHLKWDNRLNYNEALLQMKISKRAIRFQPTNKKCRASSAQILSIHDLRGKKLKNRVAYSVHVEKGKRYKYKVGTKAKPTNGFNKNHKTICAPGIHFFLEMHEAASY